MKKALVFLLAFALIGVAFAADPVIKFSGAIKTGLGLQINTPATGTGVNYIGIYEADSASSTRFDFNTEVTNGDFYAKTSVRQQWAALDLSKTVAAQTLATTMEAAFAQGKFLDKMITVIAGYGWGRPTTASNGWGGYTNKGLSIIANPIPELTLQYAVPALATATTDMTIAFQKSMLWAKYAMTGVGTFLGGAQLNLDTANTMAAHFSAVISAVTNLNVQAEGYLTNLGATTGQVMKFREILGYNLKDMVAGFSVQLQSDQVMDNTTGKEMSIAINPSVTYAFDINSIGFGATYTMNSGNVKDVAALSIDPSYTATFNGNAKIKVAASYGIADLKVSANTLKVYTNFLYSF